MRAVNSIALHWLSSWRSENRVIVAFLLGIALTVIPSYRYISFAAAVGSPVQIVEPFIIAGSSDSIMPGILLGALLLVSKAPFISPVTPYEVLRIGKKRWSQVCVVYLIASCIIYHLVIAAAFSVIAVSSGRAYFDNQWSQAVKLLAKDSDYAITNYHLAFEYPAYISAQTPYSAFLQTLMFNGLYAVVLALCIFLINLVFSAGLGWVVAVILHMGGMVIQRTQWLAFRYGRYSLLTSAMPANNYGGDGSTLIAFSVLAVPSLILILFSTRLHRRLDVFQRSRT